jgi:hypothetical protein
MVDRHIALAAAGFIIAGKCRDPFEQRRLPRPVLTDDDRDGTLEVQLEITGEGRQNG